MAHLVESMSFVGQVPWHGLGHKLETELTAVSSLVPAGLDWEVSLKSLDAMISDVEAVRVSSHRAVVRTSDRSVLGVVGSSWEPVQNCQLAELADAIVGQNVAACHTAGSLDGGRIVWFLLKFGEVQIGRDSSPVEKFLLLSNAHDGSRAVRALFTPVRVVCANTLTAAMHGRDGEGITVRHFTGVQQRLEAARLAIKTTIGFYGRFEAIAQLLAETPFSEQQMRELAEGVYPGALDGEVSTRSRNNQDRIVELFEGGAGHEGILGTAWAAWNAVAQHADHGRAFRETEKTSRTDNRLRAVWFGSSAKMKADALTAIGRIAGLKLGL